MDDARRRRVASDLHYEGPTNPKALLNEKVSSIIWFIWSCNLNQAGQYFICSSGFFYLKANALLGSYKPVRVDIFSEQEINNYIDYYIEKNWLQTPHARTDEGREEIKFLSGSNPAQFRRVCESL